MQLMAEVNRSERIDVVQTVDDVKIQLLLGGGVEHKRLFWCMAVMAGLVSGGMVVMKLNIAPNPGSGFIYVVLFIIAMFLIPFAIAAYPPQWLRQMGPSIRLTQHQLVIGRYRSIPLEDVQAITYIDQGPQHSGIFIELDTEKVRLPYVVEPDFRDPLVRMLRQLVIRRKRALLAEGYDLSAPAQPPQTIKRLLQQP